MSVQVVQSNPRLIVLAQSESRRVIAQARAPVQIVAAKQGPAGPIGPPGNVVIAAAGAPLGGQRMVFLDAAGQAQYASADNPDHVRKVLGMTTGAAAAGAPVAIQTEGEIADASWSWIPEQPIYLGANGLLTQVPPSTPAAVFSLVVGVAISATKIILGLREPVILS